MGVQPPQQKCPQLVDERRTRHEVADALKALENVSMRRFLRPAPGKRRDVSEGEYKRLENMLHKMARKQKTALFEAAETLKILDADFQEELSVLNGCFRNANDQNIFRASAVDDSNRWVDQFMEVMSPWAEWLERSGHATEEVFFLDVFWAKFEASECLAMMLRMCCILQELELMDGQLQRFIQPYDVELIKSPWYEVGVADRLLQKNPWIGELVFLEQLFTPNTRLNALISEAVEQERQIVGSKSSFEISSQITSGEYHEDTYVVR